MSGAKSPSFGVQLYIKNFVISIFTGLNSPKNAEQIYCYGYGYDATTTGGVSFHFHIFDMEGVAGVGGPHERLYVVLAHGIAGSRL